jgi:hypothetical protein
VNSKNTQVDQNLLFAASHCIQLLMEEHDLSYISFSNTNTITEGCAVYVSRKPKENEISRGIQKRGHIPECIQSCLEYIGIWKNVPKGESK